jgi:pyrophosphatase PpaX
VTKLTTFLFDLDGTLLDSVRLILDSYHHTTTVHGLPRRSDQEWLAGLGTPLRVQFRDSVRPDLTMDQLVATYREFNLANHDLMAAAYPGVVDVLRQVRARGIRFGLVTSKNQYGARLGLKLMGVEEEFEVVIGADDVVNPKPHPEPVLKALDLMKVRKEEAVYIGDSVHDMESGRAAGVRIAGVLWGPFTRPELERTKPDDWLERPEQLLELVGDRRGT